MDVKSDMPDIEKARELVSDGRLWPLVRDFLWGADAPCGEGKVFADFSEPGPARIMLLDAATVDKIARWIGVVVYSRQLGAITDGPGVRALKAVGLGDRLEHKSNQMSGGQMQRVAIARALVNDPAVLLADEATGNLDTRTSFEMLVLFQELYKQGHTIIFVTHNPEIAEYSSRNINLRDGKIREDTQNTNIKSAAEALAALPLPQDD